VLCNALCSWCNWFLRWCNLESIGKFCNNSCHKPQLSEFMGIWPQVSVTNLWALSLRSRPSEPWFLLKGLANGTQILWLMSTSFVHSHFNSQVWPEWLLRTKHRKWCVVLFFFKQEHLAIKSVSEWMELLSRNYWHCFRYRNKHA
jgi:hypothetical protein